NCRRSPELIAERVFAQHLELRSSLEHVGRAAVIQAKDLAVISPGRRPEGPGTGQAFAPVSGLAAGGFVAAHTALVQDVEVAAIHERGGARRPGLWLRPDQAGA